MPKIQFIGDGTASYQTFTYPGGRLVKWQSLTVPVVPRWVETAPARTFLIDGRPNPAPKPKPAPAAKPEPK